MKQLIFNIFILAISISLSSCNNEAKTNEKETSVSETVNPNTIQVIYFHGNIRCTTCVSVDEATHKYLDKAFSDELKTGKIIFKTINIDENEREDLIQKYEIYGQTMLFIKGDKVINKTDDAFKYASTNPEKWKQIVKNQILELN